MRAEAQLGELQLGVAGAYGPAVSARSGAGLVIGVAPGRLAYVGLRWTRYSGSQRFVLSPGGEIDVRTRSQVIAADVAVMIPAGPLDLMPGVTIGDAHFTQLQKRLGVEGVIARDELWVAPGVAAEIHLGRLAIIPEVQYALAGRTEFPFEVARGGMMMSVRLVWTKELRRITR